MRAAVHAKAPELRKTYHRWGSLRDAGFVKQLMYSSSGDVTGITNGRYSLVECAHAEADPVIARHHYSHKTTKSRFLSLSVNSGLGYVQLGYGIRPRLKRNISTLITAENYCEFDRMWLSDILPKFAESQVIALLLSYLKQVHRGIKFVITYADESAGNRGTIYRATNAIELAPVVAD